MLIEDYALVGDTHSCALVSREGSVDWLCLPRFDGGALFAALLGDRRHGHWRIAPAVRGDAASVDRRYRPESLVLETETAVPGGRLRVTDCMPTRDDRPRLVRLVECVEGSVEASVELVIRPDYGSVVPWVNHRAGGLVALAGPDGVVLHGDVDLHGEDFASIGRFRLAKGEQRSFSLSWFPSHEAPPPPPDVVSLVDATDRWWREWSARAEVSEGPWRDLVVRSLITLKALTYAPTGGIVAAATTSLPERLGGVRNWDYRYCWLRDATFTLYALLNAGYRDEAVSWRDWLVRAVAGRASQMQILYGPAGERRLSEQEIPWLPGYEGSSPVRIGNAAHGQFQLDVYGEIMDALDVARRVGLEPDPSAWALERELLDFLEGNWEERDEGIWEVRGPRRHFTYSKVMAWVAFDRALRAVEEAAVEGPVDRWRTAAAAIHNEVCRLGYDAEHETFVQCYGSRDVDASLLLIPQVGFLPITDGRVQGTIRAVEERLLDDGFVRRYTGGEEVDGLPQGEGAFLPCAFWLADAYAMAGRRTDAEALFARAAGVANDVGLLSEEYDTAARRLVGNFPQAFSHLSLVNTAHNLAGAGDGAGGGVRAGEGAAGGAAQHRSAHHAGRHPAIAR